MCLGLENLRLRLKFFGQPIPFHRQVQGLLPLGLIGHVRRGGAQHRSALAKDLQSLFLIGHAFSLKKRNGDVAVRLREAD